MRQHSVSQFSQTQVGVAVYEVGVLTDADSAPLLTITRKSDGIQIIAGLPSNRDDVGLYSYEVGTDVTSTKDEYTEHWDYSLGGVGRTFEDDFLVGEPQPFWDSLNSDQKTIVDNVYGKISDTFDSSEGGPYLWELPQTTFGFETVARLLVNDAMAYINFSKPPAFQPPFQMGANATKAFPPAWYGIAEKACYTEVLKHLQRSYIEQANPQNVTTARLDRQDYWQKWGALVAQEKEELDHFIGMMKRSYRFGLLSRASLVAGGYWPMSYYSPTRPRWPYSPSVRGVY